MLFRAIYKKNDVSISNRFPGVHKRGTNAAHTHTDTHTDAHTDTHRHTHTDTHTDTHTQTHTHTRR